MSKPKQAILNMYQYLLTQYDKENLDSVLCPGKYKWHTFISKNEIKKHNHFHTFSNNVIWFMRMLQKPKEDRHHMTKHIKKTAEFTTQKGQTNAFVLLDQQAKHIINENGVVTACVIIDNDNDLEKYIASLRVAHDVYKREYRSNDK